MEKKKTTRSSDQLLLENEELRSKLAKAEGKLNVLLNGNVTGTIDPELPDANHQSVVGNRRKGINLSSLFASMSEGYAVHELVYDTSGRAIDYIITEVNPAFEKITGINKKSSLGKKATEVYSVTEAPYLATYAEVVSSGKPASFVTYFPPMEKHFTISVFSPEKGKFATVFQDISERKLTEEKLRITLNRFYLMLSSMRNGLLLLTPDNRVEFANHHFCEVFDLKQSPDELLNRSAGEIIALIKESYTDPEKEIEKIKKIIDEKIPVIGEEITMKSGRTYLRDFIPLFVGEKNHGRLWVHIDISDTMAESLMRKKNEEALKQSEKLYRAIGESIDYGIWICDANGKNTYASESYLKLVGLTQQQCSDFGWGDTLHPDDAERTMAAWKKCSSTGDIWDIEHRFRGVDGQWHPILARGIPVRDDDGKIIHWAGINLDISKIKQTEDALRNSEERFRKLIKLAPAVIYEMDIHGEKFLSVNDTMCTLLGYTREELAVIRPIDLLDKESQISFRTRINRRLTGEKIDEDIEYRVRTKSGDWIDTLLTVGNLSFPTESEPNITVIAYDITERKKTEAALRESEKKFRELVKYAPTAIYELDFISKKFITVNDAMCNMSGYSRKELLAINALDILEDESKKLFLARVSRCFKGEKPEEKVEYKVKSRDGRMLDVILNMKFNKDENGRLVGAMVVGHDITERKRVEEELRANEAKLKELIATKDKFFNIVAHDLKNPFTSLLGSSELLFNNIDQMTRLNVKKLALILNDSAKGGYAILQNLLDWSRSQTGILKFNPEKVNLKTVIDENIHNLHLQGINKGIFLKSELTEDYFILADKNMIITILRNLLSNAVKYTYKNGKVTVGVSVDMEETTISVRDSGIGISKEKADTLFRIENSLSLPGTEKEQGTGLGLKLCKEFTERMGGRIWVESEPGKGSEFKFTIPGKS